MVDPIATALPPPLGATNWTLTLAPGVNPAPVTVVDPPARTTPGLTRTVGGTAAAALTDTVTVSPRLPLTVSVAMVDPPASGVTVNDSVQLRPALKLAPVHPSSATANWPPSRSCTVKRETVDAPVFVIVTSTGSEVVPTGVAENDTVSGLAASRPGAKVIGVVGTVGRVVGVGGRVAGVTDVAVTATVAVADSPCVPVAVSVARRLPARAGIAVTSTAHVAPGASVAPPQPLPVMTNWSPSPPPIATESIATPTSPLLVTVAETGPPRGPTGVFGNDSVDGDIDSVRTSARPVPDNDAVAETPCPPTVSEAFEVTESVGVNTTVTVHVPAGGTRKFEHVSAEMANGAASGADGPSAMPTDDGLVNVTAAGGDDEPMATVPRSNAGVTVSAGWRCADQTSLPCPLLVANSAS